MPPRKTSDCDLLQMTKDFFRAVPEWPRNDIRYLCVHCNISVLMQTDDANDAEVPVRGFLQTTKSHMSKWAVWLQSPREWRPMRGVLEGNKEFEGAKIEARSAGSQWASLLVEGTLGRNKILCLYKKFESWEQPFRGKAFAALTWKLPRRSTTLPLITSPGQSKNKTWPKVGWPKQRRMQLAQRPTHRLLSPCSGECIPPKSKAHLRL